MKQIVISHIAALMITCSYGQTKDAAYYRSKGYQVFPRYGVVVKAPVQLQDVSMQAEGDFALNLGGIEDENKSTLAFYQFIVSALSAGYRNYSESKMQEMMDEQIRTMTASFTNVKKVCFGEEGCIGYVGDTKTQGYKQNGLVFYRKGHTCAVTVITNYQLEQRFNKFSNGVKFY